ncbi:hypothetical protein [Nostoc sp.]|uniref:hypothetical protein n=1 Tax=Nostoc sp. TaxID=1180 RepID=UPI002FFA52D2
MARPKKLAEDSMIVSVRIGRADWENFETVAQAMGYSKADLLRMVVEGKIPVGQLPSNEIQLMGKSSSVSN